MQSKEQELEQLVLQLEEIALREHIARGLFPEFVDYLEQIQQAIDQCVRGEIYRPVELNGVRVRPEGLITMLFLWPFVCRRRKAGEN